MSELRSRFAACHPCRLCPPWAFPTCPRLPCPPQPRALWLLCPHQCLRSGVTSSHLLSLPTSEHIQCTAAGAPYLRASRAQSKVAALGNSGCIPCNSASTRRYMGCYPPTGCCRQPRSLLKRWSGLLSVPAPTCRGPQQLQHMRQPGPTAPSTSCSPCSAAPAWGAS